jgi:hypothetical protein
MISKYGANDQALLLCFVPQDPPQVGFESRVMGDYLARFREQVYVVCAGEWKPPPQKRSGFSHGSVTIDSIYYYGKSLYQDVNHCIKPRCKNLN